MVSNTLFFIFGLFLTLFLQSTSFPVTLPSVRGNTRIRPGKLPTGKPVIFETFDEEVGGIQENWNHRAEYSPSYLSPYQIFQFAY